MESGMSARIPAVVIIAAAIALVAPIARADEPTTSWTTPQTGEPARWYGGQILVGDIAAFTLMGIALSVERPAPFAILGVGGYFITPLVLHAVHGQGDRAAASVALRIIVPFFFAGIGSGIGHQADKPCAPQQFCLNLNFSGIEQGGLLGMFTASMIDVFALGWEPAKQPTARATSTSFEVGARPVRGGTVLTLGRAF
jgi:hypothetical protein